MLNSCATSTWTRPLPICQMIDFLLLCHGAIFVRAFAAIDREDAVGAIFNSGREHSTKIAVCETLAPET